MSGTSVDGLDLALIQVETDGAIQIKASESVPLPEALRASLLELEQPGVADGADNVGAADADLGQFTGEAVNDFLSRTGQSPEDTTAIGSHGQTIRHRPGVFTMQIGDPNRIAEVTGITTVADFRRRDFAAGGQGAPLVPPFHQALFANVMANAGASPVVLNIGGISNVTILGEPPHGFDTGPGNCLMDGWIQHHRSLPYDEDGNWAASGSPDSGLLQTMLQDPFFNASPPKSTGREYFNLEWLQTHLQNQPPADVAATLCELTAQTIIMGVSDQAPDATHLIVCGGGRLNGHLMSRLTSATTATVEACETFGVDGDSLEAAAFAWLAHRTIDHLPGNEPAVTGASGYRVLGGVYPA